MDITKYLKTYKDGCIQHTDFYTGEKAWYTPGRNKRPQIFREQNLATKSVCPFCRENWQLLTPVKYWQGTDNISEDFLSYPDYEQLPNLKRGFRRVANLFEIIPFNFWKENYSINIKEHLLKWQLSYLEKGFSYVKKLTEQKFGESFSDNEIQEKSISIFAGSHDVILYPDHWIDRNGEKELAGPGDLNFMERTGLIVSTVKGIKDIELNNPGVSYVSVFENYLPKAGASILHPHRQLVGTDQISRRVECIQNKYQENGENFFQEKYELGEKLGLILQENETAYLSVALGSTHPALEVICKDNGERHPWDYSLKEMERIAQLLESCHNIREHCGHSLNEEWFYRPANYSGRVPWEIRVRFRESVNAGFEGGMGISILPHSPFDMKNYYNMQRL